MEFDETSDGCGFGVEVYVLQPLVLWYDGLAFVDGGPEGFLKLIGVVSWDGIELVDSSVFHNFRVVLMGVYDDVRGGFICLSDDGLCLVSLLTAVCEIRALHWGSFGNFLFCVCCADVCVWLFVGGYLVLVRAGG
jgi:hypothetical protein